MRNHPATDTSAPRPVTFETSPDARERGAFATVARFSVRRRRWVVLAWTLLFVAGVAAGAQLFMRLKDTGGGGASESARGSSILTNASTMGPMAVVLVKGPSVAAPSTRDAVQALTARLERVPQVTGAVNAYTSRDPMLRGRDGHASLILVSVRKDAAMMDQRMAVDAMRATARGSVPGATVEVGGDVAVMRDGMTATQHDLLHGELIAFPILIVALFLIFGGLRAALLPIIGAIVASAGTLLPLLGVTYLTDLAP